MADSFKPTLYVNHRCPFCLKFMIYLAQAGLLEDFTVTVFEPGSPEHEATKTHLIPHFDSVSFPVVEVEPGVFKKDSDALIAYYAEKSGKKAADMPLLDYYSSGVLKQVIDLFMENRKLKEEAAANA
jgi:hypothetical protein